ncbi:MAG: HAMP domain-containing histidine kinase [Oscillospiraceae bacterium]|jgi:signal transduction histidine kinase|nr:HAMP domain-containing histidine kinase [Oscillospiraceae bacterium]
MRKTKPVAVKLWLYFTLFAAVIMTMLWLMQIVLLQSFYVRMKTSDVKQTAADIAAAYGRADFELTVDRLTFRNSILVFVTDTDGSVLYSSDEHGSGGPGGFGGAGGIGAQPPRGNPRPLPEGYGEFLRRLAAGGGEVSYTDTNSRLGGKSLVYGTVHGGLVLYISTPLEPLNATTAILRTQLVYVTIASLLISLVIAFFIARKFSRPISRISEQAATLAGGGSDVTFDKGFCAELDELSATLDDTAAQLARVETLRRELLANISHDLRTPLTMIKAYSEMIRDISGEKREKREEHLAVITRESDRLSVLVDDILDLSAIQAGGDTLNRTNLNLSETVRRTLAQFAPLCERENIAVTAEVEPDQYALADEKRLTQVLYNLIGNAIAHVGADRAIAVRLSDLGGAVRFEVTDNGDGIAPEDLPLIWDRYYTSKERGGTSGLGLSIAKSVLEAHGARYGAVSAVGQGSTFWFEVRK